MPIKLLILKSLFISKILLSKDQDSTLTFKRNIAHNMLIHGKEHLHRHYPKIALFSII